MPAQPYAVVDGRVAALSAAAQELQRTAATSAEQKQEAESKLHAQKEEAAALTARVEELMSAAAALVEQKQQVES